MHSDLAPWQQHWKLLCVRLWHTWGQTHLSAVPLLFIELPEITSWQHINTSSCPSAEIKLHENIFPHRMLLKPTKRDQKTWNTWPILTKQGFGSAWRLVVLMLSAPPYPTVQETHNEGFYGFNVFILGCCHSAVSGCHFRSSRSDFLHHQSLD